jgi:regulator of cell morphogenesis and NO signaling
MINKITPVLTPEMKMADLIHQNYKLLFVLDRVGIPLGFGEKTVEQVCIQNNVDTKSFLILSRLHTSPFLIQKHELDELSPSLIVEYLQRSHHYFLKQRLPDIGEKLNIALSEVPSHDLILKFFEEYENEVAEHMEYENNVFFPYIEKLLAGEKAKNYSVADYQKRHNNIEEKLTDLSNLLLKYLTTFTNTYLISNVLLDLDLCNEDLNTHSFLEEDILIPNIKKIEESLRKTL